MIRTIIVEDNPLAQRILKKYIQDSTSMLLVGVFSDAVKLEEFLNEDKVDLMFLDIHLPRLSGMDFLKSMHNHPLTIMTTAYSEYALECYQYNVVDYLLKPFSFERFTHAVNKAIEVSNFQLEQSDNSTQKPEEVFIKTGHEIVKILRDKILYINSDTNYTEIFTADKKYLTTITLKEWPEKLGDNFCQVHKSYVVNRLQVLKISQSKIYLRGDNIILIGRAYKKSFMEQYES